MKGKLRYFHCSVKPSGDYSEDHTEDDCDKCLKRVGEKKLKPVPFLLLMKNDNVHGDASYLIYPGKYNLGYRQYFVCGECYEKEMRGR